MGSSPALLVTLVTVVIACIAVTGAAFTVDPAGAYLITIGFMCFAIICASFWFRKSFDVLEPMTLTAISVFIGGPLRAVYFAFLPSNYSGVTYLIGNMKLIDLAIAESTIPLSLILFVVGYLGWKKRVSIQQFRPFRTDIWPTGRTMVAVVVLAAIGMTSLVILVKDTGVSFADLATLSEKRTIDLSGEGGDKYSHAGYLRWLVTCTNVATLILYTKWAGRTDSNGRFKKFGILRTGVIVFMMLLSMIWPILSSSRSDVVQIVFSVMIIHVYLRNRGNLKRFLRLGFILLGFALAVLVGMGLWRNLGQKGKVDSNSFAQSFVDKTVGSGNFFPPERVGYIVSHYQGKQFYLGSTYLSWLAAPIPKSEWPGRPDIGLGLIVKDQIYQRATTKNGYPPSMLGEAYMNFGYVGMLFMPLFLGAFMKFLYLAFKPLLGVNKNATVLYAAIFWCIGMQLPDGDFTLFMLNMITMAIPLVVFFWFMKKPKVARAMTPAPTLRQPA